MRCGSYPVTGLKPPESNTCPLAPERRTRNLASEALPARQPPALGQQFSPTGEQHPFFAPVDPLISARRANGGASRGSAIACCRHEGCARSRSGRGRGPHPAFPDPDFQQIRRGHMYKLHVRSGGKMRMPLERGAESLDTGLVQRSQHHALRVAQDMTATSKDSPAASSHQVQVGRWPIAARNRYRDPLERLGADPAAGAPVTIGVPGAASGPPSSRSSSAARPRTPLPDTPSGCRQR